MITPLPTLTFTNKFSNGLVVTLQVIRAEFEPPIMVPSHRGFDNGIEEEQELWVNQIARTLIEEKLITTGEMLAIALRHAMETKNL